MTRSLALVSCLFLFLATALLHQSLPVTADADLAVSPSLTFNHYFGNLHSHTSYSDGSGSPAEAYRYAKEKGKLDFLAITEHNHAQAESGAGEREDGLLIATDPSLYDKLIGDAEAANEDGKFAAIYGQEFSSISKGNHTNVFMAKKVITTKNGNYKKLFSDDWMNEHGVEIIEFNHPWDGSIIDDAGKHRKINSQDCGTPNDSNYGFNTYAGRAAFVQAVDGRVKLVEVANGPALTNAASDDIKHPHVDISFYTGYLNMGLHVAPTADQDNHYKTWGTITEARTVVLAPKLTRPEILKALSELRVYASEDKNLEIDFTMNGAVLGSRLKALTPEQSAAIRVHVADRDDQGSSYEVALYYDNAPGGQRARLVEKKNVNNQGEVTFTHKPTRGKGYYFIQVTGLNGRHDGYRAWTAPVWFED